MGLKMDVSEQAQHQNWQAEFRYLEDHYVPFLRHSASYQEILTKIVRLVRKHLPNPRLAVEFGCGPGLVIAKLLQSLPSIWHIDGYDYSLGLAEVGLRQLPILKKNFDKRLFFHEGPQWDLTMPLALHRRFDLVVSNNVLYIFKDPPALRQAVRNLVAALDDEGLLIVSTVTANWNTYFAEKHYVYDEIFRYYLCRPWRLALHLVPQLRHMKAVMQCNRTLSSNITLTGLRQLVEENGLEIIDGDIFYTPQKYRRGGLETAGGIMLAARRRQPESLPTR
jgi:SAM-dependent methyltransferase